MTLDATGNRVTVVLRPGRKPLRGCLPKPRISTGADGNGDQ